MVLISSDRPAFHSDKLVSLKEGTNEASKGKKSEGGREAYEVG